MRFSLLIGFILLTSGCRSVQKDSAPPLPLPAYAGIVRSVNRAEHYLIFESDARFAPGTNLTILRNGRKIGTAVAIGKWTKKFQAANIFEGAPLPGDLCEAEVLSTQPQIGQ